MNDLRPISSCNVSYKFISRLLVNRLRMVPPKLISLLQIVFVPHRDIHDNILIAHETFYAFHKKGEKQVMAIKLEMEKAYDRLE